eukprot:9464770-Pyramimonas_sp.AAC.1
MRGQIRHASDTGISRQFQRSRTCRAAMTSSQKNPQVTRRVRRTTEYLAPVNAYIFEGGNAWQRSRM